MRKFSAKVIKSLQNPFVSFVTAVMLGLSWPSASMAIELFTYKGTWEIASHTGDITFTLRGPLRDGAVQLTVTEFTGDDHGFVPGETAWGTISDNGKTLRVDSLADHDFIGNLNANEISGEFCGTTACGTLTVSR